MCRGGRSSGGEEVVSSSVFECVYWRLDCWWTNISTRTQYPGYREARILQNLFKLRVEVMNETLKYVVWALVTVGLFYGDLGTDVALLVDLVTVQKDLVLAAVVGGILILHVLVLSLYDMFAAGGLGLKGVVLNLTFTRVLYIVFSPSCKDTPYDDAKR